jgi:hypothetical protein
MAQINLRNIKKIEKIRNTIHEKVHATYTIFEADSEKFVQIDTYGRVDRENPEKISQSFQFDKETAEFLVKLLQAEFNIQ